jgi:hypothetical protein
MDKTHKIKVYCETTIISDMVARPSPLIRNLARQIATHEWWESFAKIADFYVSQLVSVESTKGDTFASQKRGEFLSQLKWLEYGKEALELAKKFLDGAAVPETSFDDATHIAIATIAKMDCLATWNCRHINNPETLPKIRAICESNGYGCPIIGTPEQLKEVYHGRECEGHA